MTGFCGQAARAPSIPDFELASLNGSLQKGEIDLENCVRIYMALHDISESEAADETFRAGLTNGAFNGYVRHRWGMDGEALAVRPQDRAVFEHSGAVLFQ